MRKLRLTCLLPLALILSVADSANAQEQGKIKLRVFDVRDIVSRQPEALPATVVEASFLPDAGDTSDDPLVAMELSDVVTLIQECTGPSYWERDGVEIRPEESGLVSVRCSAEQHAFVAKTLQKIRHLLFEPITIEVHELPASALSSRRTVITAQEADKLVAAAGPHPVHVGRTTLNNRVLIEPKQLRNRVDDIRMRVASNASMVDPVLATDAHGASWDVWARRTVSGALLLTAAGSTRALESRVDTRRVGTGKNGEAVELDLQTTKITTCMSSARLKPGEALLVGSNAPDGQVVCIRVRRHGQQAGRRLGYVEAYPIASMVLGVRSGPNPTVPFEDARLFPEAVRDSVPAVLDADRLMELICSEVNSDSWDGAPHTMHVLHGRLMVHADDQTNKEILELLQSLDQLDARQYTLEVRFGEVAAKDAKVSSPADVAQLAESLQQFCLSTVSPRRGTQLSATRHRPGVHDYSASVASGSAAASPHIGVTTEGFLLRGAVTPMQDRTVMLDLDMTILTRGGAESVFDLKHPAVGPIDKLAVRQNKVRGHHPVELDNWTIMHLAPAGGGEKHVAVAARVHAL